MLNNETTSHSTSYPSLDNQMNLDVGSSSHPSTTFPLKPSYTPSSMTSMQIGSSNQMSRSSNNTAQKSTEDADMEYARMLQEQFNEESRSTDTQSYERPTTSQSSKLSDEEYAKQLQE